MPRSGDDDDDDDEDDEISSDFLGSPYDPVNESGHGSGSSSPEERRLLTASVWGGSAVSTKERNRDSNPLSKSQFLSLR